MAGTARRPGLPMGSTLAEKLWRSHLVDSAEGLPDLLYVDLHLMHEMTSPQAFEGLRMAERTVRRPDLTVATADHNVPTSLAERLTIADPASRAQVNALRENCAEFGITLYDLGHAEQGILHVIGPELGLTQPGMLIACGDSHTTTHGALGALAFGIGTSEVEHILATQTLPMPGFRTMAVTVNGSLPAGTTAKDLILAIIARIGTGGGQGHVIEFRGAAIRALSVEDRLTVCNMAVEAGGRAGVIAPDEVTLSYLRGRRFAPSGTDWEAAAAYWLTLRTDDDAVFDREVVIDGSALSPHVTWGTNPGQAVPLDGAVPAPESLADPGERQAAESALAYMGLSPGTRMRDIRIDTVFIGSCTNGRISDLRAAADVIRGRKVAAGIRMLVVPGSTATRLQAEAEGLHEVFLSAGAEWREAGCSMCIGVNPDRVAPGDRSASTSNRNFEGRQGTRARTHLVSPEVAAATAVAGQLASPVDIGT